MEDFFIYFKEPRLNGSETLLVDFYDWHMALLNNISILLNFE